MKRIVTISEDYLRALVAGACDAIVTATINGQILYYNRPAAVLFGYNDDELNGKLIGLIIPEWSCCKAALPITSSKNNRSPLPHKTIGYKKNSEAIYITLTVSKIGRAGEGFYSTTINNIGSSKVAEQSIQRPNEFLEEIFRTIGDGIIVIDAHGDIVCANEALLDMLGYDENELLGKNYMDLVAQNLVHPHLLERLQTYGFVQNYELQWTRKDGRLFPIETNMATIRDCNGTVKGGVAAVRDISSRKEAMNALHKSEEKFRVLAETATDAIVLADESGKVIFWNKAAERIYGYKASEILGRQLAMIIPPGYRRLASKAIQQVQSGKKNIGQTHEVLSLRKDGTEFYSEISFSTGRLEDEQFHCGIIRDVTERKNVQEALIESEERLRVLAESAVDAIILIDAHRTIVFWNRGARNIIGYEESEVIGKPVDIILPARLRSKNKESFENLKRKGTDFLGITAEKLVLRRDGTEFPAEVSYSTLNSSKGTYYFAIMRDISERMRAAKMLDEVNQCVLGFGSSAGENIKKAVMTACILLGGDCALYVTRRKKGYVLRASWQTPFVLKGNACDLLQLWDDIIAQDNGAPSILTAENMNKDDQIGKLISAIGMKVCIGSTVRPCYKESGVLAVFYTQQRAFDPNEMKIFSILSKAIGIEEERKKVVDKLRDNQEKLKISQEYLKYFSGRILAIREEEKKGLSRNLHDELGSLIVSVGACLSVAEEEIKNGNANTALEMINQTKVLLKESVIRIREIAVDLRPPELDITGLSDALRIYCNHIALQTGIAIDCQTSLDDKKVNDSEGIALYRVAQEAINNIIRHACARHACLRLSTDDGFIYLIITDDGKGFNTEIDCSNVYNRCLGIQGMRERVECLGGIFSVSSKLGYGSEISIQLPLSIGKTK